MRDRREGRKRKRKKENTVVADVPGGSLPCKAKGSIEVINDGHCIIIKRRVQVCSTVW